VVGDQEKRIGGYLLVVSGSRPTPTQVARKLLARTRARGPREVLATGVARLREFISSSDELVILARTAGGELPDRTDLEFVTATSADGARYARDIGTDSASTLASRLTDDTHCFLVIHEARVVHATWVTTRSAWTRELGGYLVVPEGDCYVFESFTRADARGRGVYPFGLKGICEWAANQGLKRIWVGVESGNAASLRAVAKVGFEPRLTISFRRSVGRLQVVGARCPQESIETLCLRSTG
jgi:L-amino acid N-acyltransferase YncA